MTVRAGWVVWVLAASGLGVAVACSLNPQPLPPDTPGSDAGNHGNLDGANPAENHDAKGGGEPEAGNAPEDAGGGEPDAEINDGSDAGDAASDVSTDGSSDGGDSGDKDAK
jgi:hypothetical protein